MKKFSILIALMLVLAMATGAFAAQASYTVTVGGSTYNYYSATTPVGVSTPDAAYVKNGVYQFNNFYADGKTNYPYEIYLPNEVTPANYRIHTNYTKNTDACASCHATHTAVGASLLQWYSTYETCMACHDGTVTTTYNVEKGVIGTSVKATFGGMFGNGEEDSLSSHNVTGAVEIAAAPGGSSKAESITKADGQAGVRWTNQFGCESCHSPHGQGGNARILSPDPNFVATQNNKKTGLPLTETVTNLTYAVYPSGINSTPYTWIKGYPYSKTTKIYVGGTEVTTGFKLNNANGYTLIEFTTPPTGAVTADFYSAVKVAMNVEFYLQGTEKVSHKSGMNAFCGACHTDYNTEAFTGSGQTNTGTYSKAHRHQVGVLPTYNTPTNLTAANMPLESGNLECLTCHVAHGTSTDYWKRTIGSTASTNGRNATYIDGDEKLVELAGSSALKRIPNMGTCEACHQKGDANEGYAVNSSTTSSGDPAVTNGIFTLSASNVFANFTGSASCKSCHEEQYDGWSTTIHKTMVRPAKDTTGAMVYGNFMMTSEELSTSGIVYWYANTFTSDTDAIALGIKSVNYATYEASDSPSDTVIMNRTYYVQNKIKYLLGSKWKQRFIFESKTKGLVVADGPKIQFYPGWKANGKTKSDQWDNYGTSRSANGKDWSGDCILCHTTGWNGVAWGDNVDAKAVEFAEPGISCEACHGAGANHLKAPSSQNIRGIAGLSQQNQVAVCGKCHNRGYDNATRKGSLTSADPNERYREDYYGAWSGNGPITFSALETTFGLVYRTVSGKANYGPAWDNFNSVALKADLTVKQDTYDSGNVYPDETAAGHHQQFNEFIQSGHFKSGLLTCTTCHDPHKKNVDGSQLVAQAQTICANCHDAGLDLDQYMPYITKSSSAYPYLSKTGTWSTMKGGSPGANGGGDLRSHIFKAQSFVYNQDNKNVPLTTPFATAAPLK